MRKDEREKLRERNFWDGICADDLNLAVHRNLADQQAAWEAYLLRDSGNGVVPGQQIASALCHQVRCSAAPQLQRALTGSSVDRRGGHRLTIRRDHRGLQADSTVISRAECTHRE